MKKTMLILLTCCLLMGCSSSNDASKITPTPVPGPTPPPGPQPISGPANLFPSHISLVKGT